jgi:hypothetical protein
MKIRLTKGSQERYCQEQELELLESAGWTQDSLSQGEEKIVLKPPVKSKGTDNSLDNAIHKGDQ